MGPNSMRLMMTQVGVEFLHLFWCFALLRSQKAMSRGEGPTKRTLHATIDRNMQKRTHNDYDKTSHWLHWVLWFFALDANNRT